MARKKQNGLVRVVKHEIKKAARMIKVKNKRIIKQERKLKIEKRHLSIIFNLRKAYLQWKHQ